MRSRTILAVTILMSVALAGLAGAGVLHVPDDYSSIQLGIHSASSGDTVLIAPGTYEETFDFVGKDVTVGSWFVTTGDHSYVDSTTIDGLGSLGPLVTFDGGEDSLSILSGLTLRNGRAPWGAGIFCELSSPRIADCSLVSNEAASGGGGLYVNEGDPIVERCLFDSNIAGVLSGGGLWAWSSSLRVTGCVFTGNVAEDTGGAIFCESSSPVIHGNVIDGNTGTDTYAGGIMSRDCAAVITDNVITNNHTYGHGGGLFY